MLLLSFIVTKPPRLEDEPGVQWSAEMKDFIRQTLVPQQTERMLTDV